jgi:hypothetical protein
VDVALAIGGWQDSEQKLVAQPWDQIPADALLIEERAFAATTTGKRWMLGA